MSKGSIPKTTISGVEAQSDIDIDGWLKENRLTKFETYFKESETTFEDILTWTNEDIASICDECKVTQIIRTRFENAVRKYQFKSNKSKKGSPGKIYRIVMSGEESKAMDTLKEKLQHIVETIEANGEQMKKVSKDTNAIESNIKSLFYEVRKRVNEREKALITKLNNLSIQQSKALQDQLVHLKEYQKTIQTAMGEQDSLLLDPNIESAERQINILQIMDETLMKIDDEEMESVALEMKFILDSNALYEYIADIGIVTMQSHPPTVKVSDISSYSVKLLFELPTVCEEGEIIYQLRYKMSDDGTGEWDEINIKNDYIVINLKPNTKYEVCAKYKISKDNIWSRLSEPISFQTLNNEWDMTLKGDGLTINGAIVTVKEQINQWMSIWVKGVVETGTHEWKYKIIKNVQSTSDFYFGVTNENDKKNINSYPRGLTYWTYNYKKYGSINEKGDSSRQANVKHALKENDIVSVKLDFDTKKLSWQINGKFIDEMAIEDGKYRAVVTLYYKDNAVELL